MSEGLPRQLAWRRFVCVLRQLGYQECGSRGGAARTYKNDNASPPIATFHEPHGGDTLPLGTLREYLRKLNISREKFLELLENC
jgi:predicted RNA binding protein YcfA (HicA-like mRNA interferase family)